MKTIYGYIRVSTKDQNESRQIIAMKNFGVPMKNIFMDKQSGKNFERPGYLHMLQKIEEKDTLVIQSIDRLGRNYEEIKEQWRIITKEKKAFIVVIDMPLLDTREERDLASRLISDIVLELLSYVAQTEREFIRKRQAEGILAAKEQGTHLGRKALQLPKNYEKIFHLWNKGELSANKASKKLGVSRNTFLKWARKNP